MKRRISFFFCFLVLLSGCSFPASKFSLISNKIPDGLDLGQAKTVTGKATTTYFWLGAAFPISKNNMYNLEEAVRDALSKAPDTNLLVNMQITYFVYPFPFIMIKGIEVTGQAVKYMP